MKLLFKYILFYSLIGIITSCATKSENPDYASVPLPPPGS